MIKTIRLHFAINPYFSGDFLVGLDVDEFHYFVKNNLIDPESETITTEVTENGTYIVNIPIDKCIQLQHDKYIHALQRAIHKIVPKKSFEIYQELEGWDEE